MTPFRLFEYFLSVAGGLVLLGVSALVVGLLVIYVRGALLPRG